MTRLLAIVLLTLTIASAPAVAKKDKPERNSIAGNKRIPTQVFNNNFKSDYKDQIINAKYDGFVLVRGTVMKDDYFRFHRVSKNWPDDSYDELAMNLLADVEVPSTTTGTHVRPYAQAFVMIYEADNPVIAEIGYNSGLAIAFIEARLPAGAATNVQASYAIYLFDVD